MSNIRKLTLMPNIVTQGWLPPELAIGRVVNFERFGKNHLALACHCALPSLLTPELVNLIRVNFLEETTPWVAEIDLLLSNLCIRRGDGLYEVEPRVREVLLVELRNTWSQKEILSLAKFLHIFTINKSAKLSPYVQFVYHSITNAYLQPHVLIQKVRRLLLESVERGKESLANISNQIQIIDTLELLREPLEQFVNQKEMDELYASTRMLAYYLYESSQQLRGELQAYTESNEGESETAAPLFHSVLDWIISVDIPLDEVTSTPDEGEILPVLSVEEEPVHHTIEVLICPRCNAPAEIKAGGDLSQPLQCPFCETVYTVRQSQDNEQQLKKDLKAWLDQILVSSGYSSVNGVSSVDINARRFIFRESLYPALKKEIDRRLETFENMLEAPLVQLKEMRDFRYYRPDRRLTMLAKGDNQWLKTLSTRVSAQQLHDFAVTQEDKHRLRQLQVRVLNLTYYANIAQHQSTPGGYQLVRKNIVALQKEYQTYLQEVADEHYRSYILVLDARTAADILLLDLFISALEEGRTVVPQALLFQVGNVIAQLEKAQGLALACTYNPLYTVPLQQGIQKDITTARIFQAIVVNYEVATRTRAEEFRPFYERLMRYARHLASIESAEHLLWLLTSIGRVLLARAAEAPLPVVKDWTWLDAAVEGQRRKAPGQVTLHYHPYWIAQMNYTEIGGVLVKRASTREGFLLADASSIDAPIIVAVTANDVTFPMVEAGLQNFQLLDAQVISLPAVLPYEKAEQAIRAYAYAHEAELRVLATRMLGILYLPAASLRYVDKNGKRDVVVSFLRNINQDLGQALKQTQEFLAQELR